MTLQDLKSGDKVTIEIVQLNETEDLTSTVIGSNDTGVLVAAYKKDGVVFELNSRKNKNCTFNLYCVDEHTGERRIWKGITIATVNHKQLSMYAVVVSNFGRYGDSGERRQTSRMRIDINGVITQGSEKERHYITVHDISDNGISFVAPELDRQIEGDLRILMDDQIRGHYFRLEIPCQCVRRQKMENQTLYGCKIITADKGLMEYISLKRMEMRRG